MRIRMTELILIAALLSSAFVSGCGKGKYSSPTKTFEAAWQASKNADRVALSECFTQASQAELKAIEQVRKDIPDAPNLPQSLLDVMIKAAQEGTHAVRNETIDGDRATLKVAVNEREQVHRFILEDGQWKIDGAADFVKVRKALELIRNLKK